LKNHSVKPAKKPPGTLTSAGLSEHSRDKFATNYLDKSFLREHFHEQKTNLFEGSFFNETKREQKRFMLKQLERTEGGKG